MKLGKWIKIMEEIAPCNLAQDYDNVGLLIGTEKEIKKVLVALDLSVPVAEEAIAEKVDLVLTHHPVFFHPVKRMLPDDPDTAAAYKLIRNGIGMYAAHTNLDACEGGVNDAIAESLGLEEISSLREDGIGRIGVLKESIPFLSFITVCEAVFHTKVYSYGAKERMVKTVGIVGGAGGDMISDAVDKKCDVFITGEMRHHEAVQAGFYNMPCIVAGHYQTEVLVIKKLIARLQEYGNSVKYIESSVEKSPLTIL